MADAKRLRRALVVVAVSLLILGQVLPLRSVLVSAASTDIQVNVCYPTASPTLLEPADGTETSDSSVLMSGTATANSVVYGYRNDQEVGFVTAAGDGSFSLSISLVVGANALKASTRNACSENAFSGTVTVTRTAPPETPPDPTPQPTPEPDEEPTEDEEAISDPPSVSPVVPPDVIASPDPEPAADQPIITQPQNGTTVDQPNLLVEGRARPLTKIAIVLNGQRVAEVLTDDTGRFAVSVTLKPGPNTLELITMTESGELRSPAIIVILEAPPIGTDFFSSGRLLLMGSLLVAVPMAYLLIWQPVALRGLWRWSIRWLAALKRRKHQ